MAKVKRVCQRGGVAIEMAGYVERHTEIYRKMMGGKMKGRGRGGGGEGEGEGREVLRQCSHQK